MPADEQGDPIAPRELGQDGPGVVREVGDGEALVRIDEIESRVRNPGAVGGADLGRADVETAVDLPGVGRDDRDRPPLGQLSFRQADGESGLAGGGRAGDDEERRDGGHDGHTARAMPFPHVFEPLRLRHRTLASRITFGAHTANMAERGLPGERHLAYYRERALGGAGMIVVEPVPVHRTAILTRGNFLPGDDAVIPGFRAVVDACRAANPDIVMIQQLYHVGQHGDADNSFAPNWSPSGLPSYHDADGSHAMSEAEIEEIIEAFVTAAQRAQAAGFDGVELFAAYHALIDQFWTPWSNRRRRCLGRDVRGPDALLGDDPRPHPDDVRPRLHHRPGRQHGRGIRPRRSRWTSWPPSWRGTTSAGRWTT